MAKKTTKKKAVKEPVTNAREGAETFVAKPTAFGIMLPVKRIVFTPEPDDDMEDDDLWPVQISAREAEFSQVMRPGDILLVPQALAEVLINDRNWSPLESQVESEVKDGED